jgi:hypothetical protein
MSSILDPGKAARKAAEQQRREQAVANDRQLAALANDSADTGATRRNPRGRRLFVADASQKTDLS